MTLTFQPHNLGGDGKAFFIVGGQWGSEGKGAAAGWLAEKGRTFDYAVTNAGAQAGHTSVSEGVKKVVFHLPTVALYQESHVYINAGAIIDLGVLRKEIEEFGIAKDRISVHPRAALITDHHREIEMGEASAASALASTRKGVGEALVSKIRRVRGALLGDIPGISTMPFFVRSLDVNAELRWQKSVVVEVPQGISLSVNHGSHYPYCTSRDTSVMQAMADAGIHPEFYGGTMLVLRTFPIRVGNIPEVNGFSGGHYPDQKEVSWEEIGQPAEITTVTKRVRRVFTFSVEQARQSMALVRPQVVFLTFCNYLRDDPIRLRGIASVIHNIADNLAIKNFKLIYQWGPENGDAGEYLPSEYRI